MFVKVTGIEASSLKTMMLAKTLGSMIFGILNAFVPLIFTAFIIDLNGVKWGVALIGVVFIASTSTLLGLVIAISAKEIFEAQTYSNFFRFPMILLCGLFTLLQACRFFCDLFHTHFL